MCWPVDVAEATAGHVNGEDSAKGGDAGCVSQYVQMDWTGVFGGPQAADEYRGLFDCKVGTLYDDADVDLLGERR